MVGQGQFLERPTLIAFEGGVLEGLSHRGDGRPGLLILPPPLAEGGGMEHVVSAELAFAAAHAGFPTLRFNYRGVGGSQGQPSRTPHEWLEDAKAAFELALENQAAAPVVASIGASDAVALRLNAEKVVAGLIMVSPSLVQPFEVTDAGALRVIVAEFDECASPAAWSQANVSLVVVPGAKRNFQQNLTMVGAAAVEWLKRR